MRIDHLHLERYGIFSDRKLSFHPEAALHIVLGANEAGKTSALSAIGDFIFGFGARTPHDFKHDAKLLRIGGCLRHSDGRIVTARRRKGNKNTLLGADDEPLPDDLLEQFTAGISRDLFLREYGLTADILRAGGAELLKAGGKLAETLAASSAGMSALSALTTSIRSEADEIFTARKSGGKPFYLAVERRDQADQKLRESIVTRDALKQASDALEAASSHLAELTDSHSAVGKSLALCQRALRVRQSLSRLDSLASELSNFTDLANVPDRKMAEWREALGKAGELQRQIVVLDDGAARDANEMAVLTVDAGLLAKKSTVDALRERLGAVRKAAEDLPRRRQARDAAIATLEEAARKLGLTSHSEILAQFPTTMALAQALDLIDKRKAAELACLEADARCRKLQKERDDQAAQDQTVHLMDVDHVRQQFDALDDAAALADRLMRDQAAFAIEIEAISAGLAALTPPAGELSELRSLPIPDAAVIGSYTDQFVSLEEALKRAESAVTANAKTIAAAEGELAQLSREGSDATRSDLLSARDGRDQAFTALRNSLDGDRRRLEERVNDLQQSSQTIDTVTDRLLSDTQRATRIADLRSRLENDRREQGQHAALHDQVMAHIDDLNVAWRQLWSSCRVAPEAPHAMMRWREKIEAAIVRLNATDTKRAEIQTLEMRLLETKVAIVAFLQSVGRVADQALPPAVLYREAKARLEQLHNAWTEARTRSVTKGRIESEFAEANLALHSAQESLAQIGLVWPEAMAGIGLGGSATAIEANAAMAVWQSVPLAKRDYERDGRNVNSIEQDLRAFEEEVFSIIDRLDPKLRGATAEDGLLKLVAAVDRTQRDQDVRERLENARVARLTKRQFLDTEREKIHAVLSEACSFVGAPGHESLPAVLDRVAIGQSLKAEQLRLRRDLPGIADGLDEAALRQESLGLDLDLLPSRIDRETLRQRDLLNEITEASAVKHQRNADLNELTAGRDADLAAAERAAADADIISIGETWLRLAAAARLGALAIERHRSNVQDPLVTLAGSFFSEATNRAFAGLAVEYGDDDQPRLVARRSSGETVNVDGLSEGSRDQLFLSLRLGLLAQRQSEPMPFIGDDLLTSFDEERTDATLRLLAAAGKRHQIILFTHHKHVAEIGRSIAEHKIDLIVL